MDSMQTSDKQIIIAYFGSILGSISLLGTIFILILFACYKQLRSFTFRLVVYMQISDLMLSAGIVMVAYENFEESFSGAYCKAQAFILNFGVFATSFWCAILTFVMLWSIKTSTSLKHLKLHEKTLALIGYAIPLFLSFL